MATIKGEIPEELERKFRRKINEKTGMKKGSISHALKEAIELWLKQEDAKDKRQLITDQMIYQQLLEQNETNYLVLDSETKKILSKGDDIIDVVQQAKLKVESNNKVEIIARDEIQVRRAQLGWRVKSRLKSSLSEEIQ
ncbi:MAG: hypothetical protein JSV04_13865 [Candidatus Heimdallarchaeota archaeon]|nr:MAG: hypothetical protein JSV04_13865 [Candidatus Heimdallarchaeota archaeon]